MPIPGHHLATGQCVTHVLGQLILTGLRAKLHPPGTTPTRITRSGEITFDVTYVWTMCTQIIPLLFVEAKQSSSSSSSIR
jgi:hypothetical protein